MAGQRRVKVSCTQPGCTWSVKALPQWKASTLGVHLSREHPEAWQPSEQTLARRRAAAGASRRTSALDPPAFAPGPWDWDRLRPGTTASELEIVNSALRARILRLRAELRATKNDAGRAVAAAEAAAEEAIAERDAARRTEAQARLLLGRTEERNSELQGKLFAATGQQPQGVIVHTSETTRTLARNGHGNEHG